MTAPLDPSPQPKSKKRWIGLSVLLLVLAGGAVAGTLYWRYARQFEETDDAYVDGNIIPVSPQIAGRIKTVFIRDNEPVAAGAKLAEIDPTDFVTRVNQAQAAVDVAEARAAAARANVELVTVSSKAIVSQGRAEVETAKAEIEHAEAEITEAEATVKWAMAQQQSAQADVEAAQAEAQRRQDDVKRYDAVDPRALSQQMKDAAHSSLDAANAQLSAALKRKAAADAQVAQEESKLVQARSTVTQMKSRESKARGILEAAETGPQQIANALAQVKTAEAAITQARQDLAAAKEQLSYTTIVAPVAGRVTRKNLQPGQYVEAGRNLLSIVQQDTWITANFKETQLTHMLPGQTVDIRIDTYPGREFRGTVESIQSGTGARFSLMPPENATGNYVKVVQRVPVKILLNADETELPLLSPGMSAVPRVHVLEAPASPAAPAATHVAASNAKGG